MSGYRPNIFGKAMAIDGDKTTTGATCIASSSMIKYKGTPAVIVGDLTTTCPQCKQTGTIATGDSRMMNNRKPQAVDGSIVQCGCPYGTNTIIAATSPAESQGFGSVVSQGISAVTSGISAAMHKEIPPIRADDILSNGVYVWTERVEAGHSYISIHKDNNLNVFTYGRFGRTGTGGVSGDGILIYLQGEDARNYFRHELYKMNARVFFIGDADIEKTYQHFYYLWEKGSKPTWLPKSAGDATKAHGRIIDVYDLSSSNCTTHTVHGLKTGGSKIFNTSYTPIRTQYPINREESFVIPLSLENYLDSKKNDFSSLTIVEMTDLFKDKYPNINNVKEGEKGIKQSGYESGTQSLSTIGSLGISFEESGGIFGSAFDAEITNED